MKKTPSLATPARLIWAFALLALLSACKKDKDAPTPDQQNDQLIRVWKMDSVTLNDQPYQGNEFDNWVLDFQKDGTYTLADGTNTSPGKWELSTGNKLLLDKGTSNETTFTVLKLDKSTLQLETTQTSAKTGEVKIVFLLSPK